MFRSSFNFDKLLDKATSHLQLEPDWVAILQICDLIRQGDVQPKAALAAIKKKVTNANPHLAFYALLVLESCVKNCGTLIHDEIGTKQYMEQLKELVKTTTHDNVKLKTLELIQAWAHAFRNSPKYRAVQDTLNIMKAEGYKFPVLKESDAMFIADTAPEWADGDVCHRCRVAFGVMQRKHHCRACGQVFCGQCSNKASTLPKFGIEKEVRVCEACYDQVNKPSALQTKEVDLPAEYLNSSLAQQQQVPPRKTAVELQEEEDLNLAIALSQSEAEHKEKEKKRATSSVLKSNTSTINRTTYSPPPSPGPSPSKLQEEEEIEPELAKYLNRKYWEQRQTVIEEHASRADVTSPSAPNISSPMPQKIIIAKQQNGEVDSQMEEFVNALRSQVEIFVNRMKSNSSRGRSIANDSSVQTLFLNITAMHSRLLRYIQEQDDSRVYYEGLQDKLTQMKDARAALDALREEHREKLRRQAEEAERKKQMLMAHKLAIMRKKKQEYLQYQRQLALQKIQEQEREMQMRQEQQKQQYIMGGYQAVSGFIGPSQGSPVRHVQYQGPGSNYNPMSPTNQGYIYGQPSVKQYPLQGYNMPTMNAMPPHMMGPLPNQEQQPTDPSLQGHEAMGRVTVSGPGMMPQMTNPIPQLQQAGGHQMGPPPPQGPPNQMAQMQPTPGHIPPQQGAPPQIPQPGPPSQMGIPQLSQSHIGPSPAQVGPRAHGPPGQVVGLPPQMGSKQPSTLPGSQGPPMQPHVSNTPISSQGSGTIQVPSRTTVGPILASNQTMQGPPGSGLPTMQGISQIPVSQGQQIQFQPATSLPPTSNESVQVKEDTKPETAELISFD
ncbi:hepatocyte growth factor regulated tyrosine kinase substrate isoform X2 [Ptiloglossa arizonensis]|uniref:hepatocyte growth factor regulated tyrosine kinase substrate isoform X2 n=1 Tax=Ptiloglossa arizonensis TaxID=3350558 RepID=UPI003F9EF486